MNIQFRPEIHVSYPSKVYSSSSKCEIIQQTSFYNQSLEWKSGQEFYLNTNLFRGKGLLLSRKCAATFPLTHPKYNQKQLIIRLVGQVKQDIDLTDLFIGGFFEKGVKGLPHPWVLNAGIQIAKIKSPHFFLHLNTSKPYIAVPLIGLVDDLIISSFHGRSAEYWQKLDLKLPFTEDWAANIHPDSLSQCNMKRKSSSKIQREFRQDLRNLPRDKWPSFKLQSNQLMGFEISDSALIFEELIVKWKLANFIPVSVDLKKYVTELPFSLFLIQRNQNKLKICPECQQIRNQRHSPIPTQWQNEGLCDACFPPKVLNNQDKFIFSLSVLYEKNHEGC